MFGLKFVFEGWIWIDGESLVEGGLFPKSEIEALDLSDFIACAYANFADADLAYTLSKYFLFVPGST